ncbi:MAG: hypothetical protein IJS09_00045 [Treponema sp.]|nr:hypothetical protein [Treponema sp.]
MAKNGGKASGGSFLDKILSLFGGGDPEADKKRLLKNIAKNLSHSKYKFYKPNGDQVLPLFGKFLWEIYKTVGTCQMMFHNQENPNYFKHMVINYTLSDEQKAVEESLEEDAIKSLASQMSFPDLKKKVKEDLDVFIGGFNDEKVIRTDNMYSVLMAFRSFCTFDFFFTLKKFDSTIHEGEFSRTPHFESIDASYLVDDIKDFASIVASMPFDSDWNSMLTMFKEVRGSEPVKANQWTKIIQRLEGLQRSRVLDMMIQLMTKDPSYQTMGEVKNEQIVDPFIDKIRTEATNTVAHIESAQKNSKVDGILMQIFNTTNITVLKNYTEGGGGPFAKKDLGEFEHARALNYLKAFLVEYVKRDVREYADLVLIRGQWATTPLSQQMSDAYNVILQVSDAITNFDDKMAADGEVGIKLKTHLPSTERSKEAANIVRTLIGDANDEAKGYIVTCTKNIIIFARNVKALIDDYPKKTPEMIVNWKELDRFAEHPINELAVEVYKKMYLISSLMQSLLGGGQ